VGILRGGGGWFQGQDNRRDTEWSDDLYYNTGMGEKKRALKEVRMSKAGGTDSKACEYGLFVANSLIER